MIKFSVLMSVYYKDNPVWLKQALDSIYFQQNIKPSEIVIVKDGPLTEDLDAVLENYVSQIKNVKLVSISRNKGLNFALNEGLKHCSYEWIARMDADDISLPNRFELQLKTIQKHQDIVLLGGYIEEYDETMDSFMGVRKVPIDYNEIKKFAKKRSPFNHMTVMFKKTIILQEGGYPDFRFGQDYALWVKLLMKGYKCLNIPHTLVKVRTGNSFIRRRHGIKYLQNEFKLLRYFKNIGYYNTKDFILYGTPRLVSRILPRFVLKFLYKRLRSDL